MSTIGEPSHPARRLRRPLVQDKGIALTDADAKRHARDIAVVFPGLIGLAENCLADACGIEARIAVEQSFNGTAAGLSVRTAARPPPVRPMAARTASQMKASLICVMAVSGQVGIKDIAGADGAPFKIEAGTFASENVAGMSVATGYLEILGPFPASRPPLARSAPVLRKRSSVRDR